MVYDVWIRLQTDRQISLGIPDSANPWSVIATCPDRDSAERYKAQTLEQYPQWEVAYRDRPGPPEDFGSLGI
jgi:hypothetical protein